LLVELRSCGVIAARRSIQAPPLVPQSLLDPLAIFRASLKPSQRRERFQREPQLAQSDKCPSLSEQSAVPLFKSTG
jgi:hypothetical protein